MRQLLVLVAVGAVLTGEAGTTSPIKHIVLLMEENRSFDHMCGYFKGVNGLTGKETNPYNTSDPNSKVVRVMNDSPYIGPFDPDHSTPATTHKIFGDAGIANGSKVAKMDGFIEFEAKRHKDPTSVMNMFTPDRLPVMHALAQEFALFDRYFCSHPGPTWPNRLFQLMGTSKGNTETSVWHPHTFIYTGKTIFDSVEEAGLDWRFYYADAPLEMAMIEKLTLNPERIHGWERFKHDIKHGELPAFSWVNPRWFVNLTSFEGANDQHPDHDVRLGEALMKEVYEELRASPKWNETLFIITYDEHGGFYDHVPTPMEGVPAPDDSESFPDKGFKFDRLGVRIPTLLVSPWVEKGTVIGKAEGPTPTSEYDLTSVLATMKKLFNLPEFLTKRDAWAGTFEKYVTGRTSPRTDCPTHLPDAPKSLGRESAYEEAARPLNDLQRQIVHAFSRLAGNTTSLTASPPSLQGEGSEWISQITQHVLSGKHTYHSR